MRYPKSGTVYRRLVENPRWSQRDRLVALECIQQQPLLRLLKNPATPARLIALAAQRYESAFLRRGFANLPNTERRKRLREIVSDLARTPMRL